MIRFGIIGFGKMGRIRAHTIEESGRAVVSRVYEPHPDAASGFPQADSAESIVNDPAIDAICICTPNYLNKPLTIASLEAGKHVFCEKPPAFTARDIEEI